MYPIIIVDDEDITRMAVSGFLRKNHKEFVVKGVFSNGADALRYLNENPVSLVITDIRMPRMDGLELSRHIYANHPGCIIIIISGYSEFEYARQAISFGVANYLLKPLDFQELSQNLKQAYEKLEAMHIEADYNEEEIQLFFTDIIGGMLTGEQELFNRFSSLSLSADISSYKGCLITLTLEKNLTLSHWKYGREKLAMALQNGLRLILPDYEIFHLFRSGMRYYFVMLSSGDIPDFQPDALSSALYHILTFTCTAQNVSTFEHIQELTAPASARDAGKLNTQPGNRTGDEDIVIQKAMSYIRNHFSQDLTREDVADAVFLSSAYFSRFFKQKTGLSFIDYLTKIRMQKAIELLSTRMKVGDIARKVGYQSRNRFFINFRLYSGYNPTEYRRNILRMEDVYEDGAENEKL